MADVRPHFLNAKSAAKVRQRAKVSDAKRDKRNVVSRLRKINDIEQNLCVYHVGIIGKNPPPACKNRNGEAH